MKSSGKPTQNEITKSKTKSPHSIGASGSKILNTSKKSHTVKKQSQPSQSIQKKLVTIKNENGGKSLVVSKIKEHNQTPKVSSVVAAARVELNKTVETPPKKIATESKPSTSKVNKLTETSTSAKKNVSCKHCNLHFSNNTWLWKHITKCHPKELQTETKKQTIKNEQQLNENKSPLETKHSNKKKAKESKQKLRDQLKSQLAAQQKLLKVQQEIIERTNKAQQDISALLAKLGDDESEDGELSEDETTTLNIKQDGDEQLIESIENSELIVAENDEYNGFVSQEYEIEEQLITDENGYVLINENAEEYQNQPMSVLIASGNDEEEFELIDVIEDQMYDDSVGIQFEMVEEDQNSIHCRIVTSDDAPHESEFVDVLQIDQIDQKMPVKVECGKIQEIAHKRLIKQDKKPDEKTDETKLLNKEFNTSEKKTNEYIQKVVQNATPTDDNKFECPICHEMVSNRYSLGPHILRLHSKQKSKICQYCDRSFTCTGDLTRHVRIHTGEKPFKCTYENCTYAFRASGDLHKHMRRHNSTTVNIRQHICNQCDRAFERNYDLKRHELTHKKNEEGIGYTCEFCSKRFVRKDQHKSHVYRHLGIKQYKCPDCDRRFSDFSNCSKHIRQCQAGDVKPFGSDDNETQYICEICNKRFKSKVGMKQHVIKCSQITELQKKLQESFQQMEDD